MAAATGVPHATAHAGDAELLHRHLSWLVPVLPPGPHRAAGRRLDAAAPHPGKRTSDSGTASTRPYDMIAAFMLP
jgi:hypothetical protein